MLINTRSSTRPKHASLALKTLSAAVMSALLCSSAYAAGFGRLTVLSSLGQPLRAEIELTSVAKEEADSLAVRLASPEAYRQANLEFHPILFSLRFSIENRGNRHILKVTSAQPVTEPFVDMLLEMDGTSSRLAREYTVLLDPADMRTGASAQLTPAPAASAGVGARAKKPQQDAATVPASAAPQVSEKPVEKQKRPSPVSGQAERAEAPKESAEPTDNYQVKKGDTLAAIASQTKPEGVSLDQMLVALYRANTKAFIGNNMNRVRAGQILSVPDAASVKAISQSEARGVVIAQAADFNAYRNKLADQVANAAAEKASDANQSAAGKITTQIEEKATPANEAKDKLKLSKANAGAKPGADKAGGTTAAPEDILAKEKALAEDKARVKELEKNINDLQKVLEVKSKDMAEQQKQAESATAGTAPVDAPAAAAGVPGEPRANANPAGTATEPQNAAAAPTEGSAPPATQEPPVAEAAKPAPVPPPKVQPAPPVETSFLDDLLDNSILLASLAVGLAAGLGALGLYNVRRRKKAQQEEDSFLADSNLKANSLFGSTGGQSVDTNNSVFNSSFSPATSQLDANEVDPVAEADVYIAYGRDAQAEEILKEALHTQPERHAIRVKLLEIYASRKDLRAFETMATELYSLTRGHGDDWSQAAALGMSLDPGNPLYNGEKSAGKGNAKHAAMPAFAPSADKAVNSSVQSAATEPDLGALEGLQVNSAYFGNTAAGANAAPEIPVASTEPAVEKTSAASALDFDLDGLDIQAPKIPEAGDALLKPTTVDTSDLDLNIGDLDFTLNQKKDDAVSGKAYHKADNAEAENDIGFDALGDLPEIGSPSASQEIAQGPASSLSFDLSDISLDLNGVEQQSDVNNNAEVHDNLEESMPALEFAQASPGLDTPATSSFSQDNFESSLITDMDMDLSPDSEMATKLDLAIAYQEIGDHDGARELLDEVIKGGTPEQSQKAKSLLLSLA